ncbi:hypothetical protein [Rhodopirellula sp. P2]|uniref:hypothetical protein n=1 Tax=Rhodopirellula sp. P2 TaxID=2127060 RepID=UPI002368E902|nr:hypothetical protein [Rhodopirellula sp. P2]WDQ15433.1 hypothetical protein PSR62_17525 [Rhodopirellula sp. P2]
MYTVDELDTVVPLSDVPQSDVGAPLPTVVADDYRLILEYLVSDPDPNWDGTYVNVVGTETDGTVALIRFRRPYAHMMGAPNEEAIAGHPLSGRGLEPFAAFEIRDSSWIRALESMNSVHPYHDRDRFLASKRHFIFVFHDSTFECVAEGFDVSKLNSSIVDSIETVVEFLRDDPI